jgi:hypothetical protein
MSFQDKVLKSLVNENKINGDVILTGEKNITLKKDELVNKILSNKNGEDYIDVLNNEGQILERQGLIHGYIKNEEVLFDIIDYDEFISAVNAFYISYQDLEEE